MNIRQLSRMDTQNRIRTLQASLQAEKIQTLRKWAREYGLRDTHMMSKEDLIFALAVGVHQGVQKQEDE